MKQIDINNKIHLFNGDNMEFMKDIPDKYYDLAAVDPPYGLGHRTTDGGSLKNSQTRFMNDIRRTNWDNGIPSKSFFDELFRISKHQIIWGGNYFALPSNRCFICWDKMVYVPTMSQVEYAWSSFDSPARYIKIPSRDTNRFHPTQKPIKLYEWIYLNYAKQGMKIIDTHLGSASSAIAAYNVNMDLDFTGIEIDEEYFNNAVKRVKEQTKQLNLF